MENANLWDDSALIESWNDALAEYKKYHSIHARGGRLEDLLHEESSTTDENTKPSTVDESGRSYSAAGVNQSVAVETAEISHTNATNNGSVPANGDLTHGDHQRTIDEQLPATAQSATAVNSGMLNSMLTSVPDEHLRNMMKAWYFAGYYTGLREGQQQAQQARPSNGAV